MNLTIDPWIPVVWNDGRPGKASLVDAFLRGNDIRDLAVRPHERIALMRLLICVAQAALDGPKDRADWQTCAARLPQAAAEYLVKWKHAFELFGDGQRFLQVPTQGTGDQEEGGGDVSKLDLCLAAGNNTSVFDNAAGVSRNPFTDPQLAINLLTYQNYSPLVGRGYKGRSPCMENNALHSLLVGENLRETVHMNLLSHEEASMAWNPECIGEPVWQNWKDLLAGRKCAIENATTTYLGRLCPVPRAIWLANDRKAMALGNGLEYPDFREATATIHVKKDNRVCLAADPNKAIWRELPAITVVRLGSDAVGGPLALQHADGKHDLSVWCGALISDGKAKLIEAVESVYLIPAALFADTGRTRYEAGVQLADRWCVKLGKAVARHHRELKDELEGDMWKRGNKVKGKAASHYWTAVEQHVPDLLQVVEKPELLRSPDSSRDNWHQTAWGKAVLAAARSAYNLACPHETPRQMKAYALGFKALFAPAAPATDQESQENMEDTNS